MERCERSNADGYGRDEFVPALTYDEVGMTAAADLPPGYRHIRRSRQLGSGQEWFVEASQRLLTWDMHRRAGLHVQAESPVALGQRTVLELRFGPIKISAPVRVTAYVDDHTVRGFAYGTLPGHAEIGEERFIVRIDEDDIVCAEISAFSRPGRWFTRVAGPMGRRVQDVITARYLDALADAQLFACPCCRHRTLPQRGQYDLCPVCDWEDDPNQWRQPDSADGANGISLIDSQQIYQRTTVDRASPEQLRPSRRPEHPQRG